MLPEPRPLTRALSFDDVIVMPGGALVPPDKVVLDTVFSKDHMLKRPLIGLVQNAKDAIVLAQQGLLGILSSDLAFGAQIDAVRQVKRHQAKLVRQPHTVSPDTNVAEAQDLQTRHHFSALPVIDPETHKVVGIVTRADIAKANSADDPVSSVMSTELLSVRENAFDGDVQRILQEQMVGQVLVLDNAGFLVGLRTASDFAKRANNPFATLDAYGRLMVGAAIHTGPEAQDRVSAMLDLGVDVILIDEPFAHSQHVQDMVTFIRRQRIEQQVTIIVGHVQTGDGARALIDSGADMLWVKAQDDALSATGVGVPGFTALQSVVDAASLLNIPVWLQSGFDVPLTLKALVAGATGVLATYDQTQENITWAKNLALAIGQTGTPDTKSLPMTARLATLR